MQYFLPGTLGDEILGEISHRDLASASTSNKRKKKIGGKKGKKGHKKRKFH